MQRDPSGRGISSLGADGVWRNWDAERIVIDARGLSPLQIKECLDRRAFDQSVEDMFRGIDGRSVDKEQMINPDPSLVPVKRSPEEREQRKAEVAEFSRKLREAGVQKDSCTGKIADYNLDIEDTEVIRRTE